MLWSQAIYLYVFCEFVYKNSVTIYLFHAQVAGKDQTSQIPNQVGDQITITLSSTCDKNLTATDPGLCTLQIVLRDYIHSSHSTSKHVCTLTPSMNSITVSELVCNAQCILTYPSSLSVTCMQTIFMHTHLLMCSLSLIIYRHVFQHCSTPAKFPAPVKLSSFRQHSVNCGFSITFHYVSCNWFYSCSDFTNCVDKVSYMIYTMQAG